MRPCIAFNLDLARHIGWVLISWGVIIGLRVSNFKQLVGEISSILMCIIFQTYNNLSEQIGISINMKDHNAAQTSKTQALYRPLSQFLAKKQTQQRAAQQKQELVILSNGEALISKQGTQKLLQGEHIYVKMIGLTSSSKNIVEFVSEPYLIDRYSCAYLTKNKILEYNKEVSNPSGIALIQTLYSNQVYLAYEYLIKQRSFFLLDGHKFGGDFLAYQFNPDSNHATFLVFVTYDKKQYQEQQISRAAGICKKSILMVNVIISQNNLPEFITHEADPKLPTDNKKLPSASNCTRDLIKLKRMLGYNV